MSTRGATKPWLRVQGSGLRAGVQVPVIHRPRISGLGDHGDPRVQGSGFRVPSFEVQGLAGYGDCPQAWGLRDLAAPEDWNPLLSGELTPRVAIGVSVRLTRRAQWDTTLSSETGRTGTLPTQGSSPELEGLVVPSLSPSLSPAL